MAEKLTARQQALKIKAEQQAKAKQPTAPAPAVTNVTNIDNARDSRHQRYFDQAFVRIMDDFNASAEGTRNDALNKATYALAQIVAGGWLLQGPTVTTLRSAALAKGLGQDEIRRTMDSAWEKGWLQPRPAPPQSPYYSDGNINFTYDQHTGEIVEQTTNTEPALTPEEYDKFWSATEQLEIIHASARARLVGPWALLGACFTRINVMVPSFVTIPPLTGGRASLNLFVGLVGPSGAGKGGATAAATDTIDTGATWEGGEFGQLMVNLGSGEGIIHAFRKRTKDGDEWNTHAVVFNVQEIDLLTATATRSGATILPVLRSMWSGEQLGFQNADPTRRIQVPPHEYRASLLVGIQPLRAGSLLDDADGGTPQRFLFVPTDDPNAPDQPPIKPEKIKWRKPLFDSLRDPFTGTYDITLPEAVESLVRDQRLEMLRNQAEGSKNASGHDTLARIKYAAHFALLAGRTTVTDDDWDLAGTLHKISVHTRENIQTQLRQQAQLKAHKVAIARGAEASTVSTRIDDDSMGATKHKIKILLGNGPLKIYEIKKKITPRLREYVHPAVDELLNENTINLVDKVCSLAVK
jgi:hypothetical protein